VCVFVCVCVCRGSSARASTLRTVSQTFSPSLGNVTLGMPAAMDSIRGLGGKRRRKGEEKEEGWGGYGSG